VPRPVAIGWAKLAIVGIGPALVLTGSIRIIGPVGTAFAGIIEIKVDPQGLSGRWIASPFYLIVERNLMIGPSTANDPKPR